MVEQDNKLGYRATSEPKDWETQKLSDIIISTQLGGNYPNSQEETSHPLIKMGNIERGIISLSKVEYIKQNIVPAKKDRLQYGDVLFNTRNTLELVGKVAIWKNELTEAYFNSNLMRIKFKPCIDNFFMNFLFNYRALLLQLKSIATGTTSVGAIYNRDLLGLQVTIPQQLEQIAIAKTLLDIDSLVTTLDRLIEKKKNIKQGAMQELLTGKKRVVFQPTEEPNAENPGQWNIESLDSCADVIDPHPSHRAPPETNYGIPFVGIGDLNEEGDFIADKFRIVDEEIFTEHRKRYDLSEGLIGIGRVASIGKVVRLRNDLGNYAISPTLAIIKAKNIDKKYLIYALRSKFTESQFEKIKNGSTRNSVGISTLRKISILVPNEKEQQKIANILSSLDDELRMLKIKKDKYRLLKVGLMQQLLTGRIRLKCQN